DFWITAMYSRSKVPPWGLSGGRDGSVNYVHVLRSDGREEKYSSCAKLPLKRGDVVRIVTANGGGYGDPRKRLRERVLADLEDGYITRAVAEELYGFDAGTARSLTCRWRLKACGQWRVRRKRAHSRRWLDWG